MTRCTDVDKLVSSYIDGDIDEHRARAVRGHARECERCARLLEDEGVLASWLGQLDPADDPPDRMWQGIQQRLATEEQRDAQRSNLALWWRNVRDHAVPVAMAAAAIAVGVYWGAAPSDVAPSGSGAGPRASTQVAEPAPAPEAVAPVATFAAERQRQIADADEHFRLAVAELRAEAGEAAASGEVAAALARIDAELERARKQAAGLDDVASRDEVHRLYREQIALLQDAALDGGWM